MEQSQGPWTAPVTVEDIPEAGMHLELAAPDAARVEIARLAGLRSLPEFGAVFDVVRRGAGAHVTGEVSARVGQTCVVTLEPIENDIKEPVDLLFAPLIGEAAMPGDEEDIAGDDPPEPLVGGVIDLGKVATEFLLLGIDPYPRKSGVKFAAPRTEDTGARPFAALASLKQRLGGGKS